MSVPTTTVARPPAVQTAFLLWLGFVALALISLTATLASSAESGGGGTGFGIFVLIAVAACTGKFRDGVNWARIVLAVVGVLNIVINVGALAYLISLDAVGELSALEIALIAGMPVLAVAALVFGFSREANQFFSSVKAARA